eukprot:1649920-Prymnesium_polylepis.1
MVKLKGEELARGRVPPTTDPPTTRSHHDRELSHAPTLHKFPCLPNLAVLRVGCGERRAHSYIIKQKCPRPTESTIPPHST